jgi:hypothetical protein
MWKNGQKKKSCAEVWMMLDQESGKLFISPLEAA